MRQGALTDDKPAVVIDHELDQEKGLDPQALEFDALCAVGRATTQAGKLLEHRPQPSEARPVRGRFGTEPVLSCRTRFSKEVETEGEVNEWDGQN